MNEAAWAWVRRLATLLTMDLDCQVAEPPFSAEDLDCRGFWLTPPVTRSDEAREKLLRKQVFTGLTAMLQHATRWKPELLVGLGQGGLIAALAALSLVTEAAARSRVTPMEVMREYRETWANMRAIAVITPVVVPQRTDLGAAQRALPEVLRLQPTSLLRKILASKGYQHGAFAKDLGGLIAPR